MNRILIILLGVTTLLIANEQKNIQTINNGERKTPTSDSLMLTTEIDSLNLIDNLFRDQIDESKVLLSESIISDITGDTLASLYNFKLFRYFNRLF